MRGHRRGGYNYVRRGSPYAPGGGGGGYRNFQVTRNNSDRDGDVSMGGGQAQGGDGANTSGSRSRFSPYLPPHRAGGGGGANRSGASQANTSGGPLVAAYSAAPQGPAGDVMMSQSSGTKWFRITIPNARKFDREWIMKTLRALMTYPFTPVHFHMQGQAGVFFVNDEQAAGELKKCSGRASAPGHGNLKLILIVVPLREPPRIELTHETVSHLRSALERRFDIQKQCLDLSNLYNDTALNTELLYLAMSKPSVSMQIVKTLRENASAVNSLAELNLSSNRLNSVDPVVNLIALMPNVTKLDLSNNLLRTEQELDRLRRLKLTELVLRGNPLAERFSDPKDYESAVRKRFRTLVKLDGKELPKQIGFEVESTGELPATTQFNLGEDESFRQLVLAFLEQYYNLYDAEKVTEREKLLDAYHENNARFSVSYFTNSLLDKQPMFKDYQDDSRNLRRVVDTQRRRKMLKQGRLSVVSTLAKLPRTKHDPATMTIDLLMASNTQLIFTISGCFKEIIPPVSNNAGGHTSSPYRAFSRTFVAVPAGAGIAITNDILSLSNAPNSAFHRMRAAASTVAAPAAAAAPAQAATASLQPMTNFPAVVPQPGETPERTQLVAQFVAESGMNAAWSRKCLEENDWNYAVAAQNYRLLQSQGVIPPDAFVS